MAKGNDVKVGEVRKSTKSGSSASYLLMAVGITELAGGRSAKWNVEKQLTKENGNPADKVYCTVKVSDAHGAFEYFGGSFHGTPDEAAALLGEAVALDIFDGIERFTAGAKEREEAKRIDAARSRQIARLVEMIEDGRTLGENVADLEERLNALRNPAKQIKA